LKLVCHHLRDNRSVQAKAMKMSINSVIKRFAADRSGQFAILFSFLLIPILAGVGLAIDYTYISQAQRRLQDSADAAALFAAKEYRKTGVLPAKSKSTDFLKTNFARVGSENDPAVMRYEVVKGKVYLEAVVRKPTAIMGIFGHKYTDVPAASVVNVGDDEELEIALALDTTYSMTKPSGTSSASLDPDGVYIPPSPDGSPKDVDRLTALKVAALKFNDAIFGAGNATSTRRIAVVPFSRYVNVGISRRHEPWIDVPPDSAATGETCSDWYFPVVGYSTNCTDASYFYDGVEVKYKRCDPIYGKEKVRSCTKTGAARWYGCVGSRSEPHNLIDAFAGKKFKGLMNVGCGTEVLPLTTDKVAVGNKISSLVANDYTYVPEGVMWGSRMLTKSMPFVEAHEAGIHVKVRKILVLMTDGENQISADLPAAPTHNSGNIGQANNWTEAACVEAKAQGIEIFSVTFGTDISAAAKSIIRNCATDPSHYFDASNAEKLVKAFENIAAEVNRMYLAG
jgi:Flp pilus assembly protein TadG